MSGNVLNLTLVLKASTLQSCVSLPFVFRCPEQVTQQPPVRKFSPDMGLGWGDGQDTCKYLGDGEAVKLLVEMQIEKTLHSTAV